jgi:hypothetical protein
MAYEVYWDDGFHRSLVRLHLTWQIFDSLGKFGVDFVLHNNPFEQKSTFELASTGHRYLRTKDRVPDLPPMLIAYEVDTISRTVTVKGAESVWEDYLVPDL